MSDPERELLIMLAAATAARYQSRGLFAVARLFLASAELVAEQIESATIREEALRTFNLILGRDPNVRNE